MDMEPRYDTLTGHQQARVEGHIWADINDLTRGHDPADETDHAATDREDPR